MTEKKVVLREMGEGIALVIMQDKDTKNSFSDDLIDGLFETFEKVDRNEELKVVVLTGYAGYFASGGTKETLLKINAGEKTFAEETRGKYLHNILLDCKIPVVAAMQGHGIGAGLTLGLSADFAVLSRESYYSANYMQYGFTPGFGATCVIPERLGPTISREMLFFGRNFQGSELQERGVDYVVVRRKDVLLHALKYAKSLAEKPRRSLVLLKDHLNNRLREKLPTAIRMELEMHKETIHSGSIRDRINERYGG